MTNYSETRFAKISSSNAGGTASAGSKTYKISLPSSWVKSLDTRDVIMTFNGSSITISPRYDAELFKSTRLSAGHSLLEIRYYDRKKLCSLIYADETSHEVNVRNFVDDPVKRAFYEIENIKGCWSNRELDRQISSLYFERSGLSKNKAALLPW